MWILDSGQETSGQSTILANRSRTPGQLTRKPLVNRPHTKERKKYTKETTARSAGNSKKIKFTTLGAEIVKEFENIDAKNKKYYRNTTQRAAADFLIAEYGFEEVKKRISVLSRTNKIPYFPSITTPAQLQDKWVQLQDAVERKRKEGISKIQEVI